MDDHFFSEILRDKLKGKNLAAIARELKIPKSLLADWHSARRLPSFKSAKALKRLADYLGMEFEELFLGPKKGRKDKTISNIAFSDEERDYVVTVRRLK